MDTEPAILSGFVGAVLILLTSFGIPLATDQRAAIMGTFAALVVLVQSIIVRYHVTPTAKLPPAPTVAP